MTTYANDDATLFVDAAQWNCIGALATAEQARDEAFAAIDAKDYTDETARIVKAIVAVSWERAEFSANEVRPRLGEVYTPRIGRAFALAQQLGFIEFTGYVTSTDVGTHAKRIGSYRRCGS